MKLLFKKLLWILLFILLSTIMSLGYQYIQYKNQEVDEIKKEIQVQADANLQQEILNNQIQNAQNFIKNINNNVALTVLRTFGKITLSHDKTPENNAWLEWLFNSDIKIYANYNTAFTIECNTIDTKIDENANVIIYYNINDIKLSYIDIVNICSSENKSIFGSSYTPEQVLALEQIARNKIYQNSNNNTNITLAKNNLESLFNAYAQNFNIKIKIIEK